MLARQEVVLAVERVAGLLHLRLDLLGGEAENLTGGPSGESFRKSTMAMRPPGLRDFFNSRICWPAADVVIRVDDQNHVNRLGQIRAHGPASTAVTLPQLLAGGAMREALDHLRFDVDRYTESPGDTLARRMLK